MDAIIDLLECPVCLLTLDTSSRVLPCQHTFCRKCLDDIVISKKELRCPECRILVNVKIDDLPPNVLLMRILGGLKQDPPSKENATPVGVTSSSPVTPTTNSDKTTDTKASSVVSPSTESTLAKTTPTTTPGQILPRPVLGAPLPHKYLPQNVCHAKALFDFQSNISGDLSFKKGDVIVLRRRIDQNWFYGHLNGAEGAFPVNHVQMIVPLPVPQCRAIFDFRMGPNEEEGCLTFSKGQIITVIRRIDQNWAEGRIGECIGIFPINFVEMNSLAKQLMGGEKDTGRTSLGEAMTAAGQAPPAPIDSPQQQQQQRLPPMPVKVEAGNNYPNVVRRAPPQNHSTANTIRRHSAEILNPVTTVPPNGTEFTRKSFNLLPYVAVFPYKPQKPDELELIKGAHYYVSERCQDGWLRGMNAARKAGVFPGNHVVPLVPGVASESGAVTSPSNQRISGGNPPTTPVSPPVLPPRNQASVVTSPEQTVPETGATEKKDSINLIKRITNNLKRSKSPPGNNEEAAQTQTPSQVTSAQPRLLQSVHSRSGSCPSQLLDLSALKITTINSNREGRQGAPHGQEFQSKAMSFGSTRVRGQKERPALHNLHRQLGERKEDLTALGTPQSMHKKSSSLDAGRLISGAAVPSSSNSNGEHNGHSGGSRNASSSRSGTHQVKEKFRCIVPYPPNSEYELGLNVGDIVLVNKKRENGWYRGVHQKSGKSGLFPASFVEPAN